MKQLINDIRYFHIRRCSLAASETTLMNVREYLLVKASKGFCQADRLRAVSVIPTKWL